MPTLGATQVQNLNSCCHKVDSNPKKSSFFEVEKVLKVMEKVSAIAAGIFAAIVSPSLFLTSFSLGIALGLISEKSSCECGPVSTASSCSIGFLERNTGVKLPAAISLAAGFAVMVAHIEHHATVFVPITGVTLGLWVGTVAQPTVNLFARKFIDMARCNG